MGRKRRYDIESDQSRGASHTSSQQATDAVRVIERVAKAGGWSKEDEQTVLESLGLRKLA